MSVWPACTRSVDEQEASVTVPAVVEHVGHVTVLTTIIWGDLSAKHQYLICTICVHNLNGIAFAVPKIRRKIKNVKIGIICSE